MKTISGITLLFVINFTGSAVAQGPQDFSVQCRKQMKELSWMAGHWSGDATYTRGPGQSITVHQEEFIEFKLDSTVLLVEGIGTAKDSPDKKVLFNAMGMINFNPSTQKLSFRSYVKEGMSTDSYFTIVGEDKYEWGFDIPNGGKIRYTITTENGKKTWKESGEYSQDGQTWYPFIVLNLQKVE